MSFFLLAKGLDGTLTLLSSKPLDTRQQAMSELSQLSSAEGFSHWEDEVLILDLHTATPVLLVRPAGEPENTVVPETSEAVVRADDSWSAAVAPEEVSEPEDAVAIQADERVEVAVAEAPAVDIVIEALEDGGTQEPQEQGADEPVAIEGMDDAWVEALAASLDEEPADSLVEALKRTAAQMEAEGITAPESVGPAQGAVAAETHEGDVSAEPDVHVADEVIESQEADTQSGEATAWPWDTGASIDDAGLSGLEEPALDVSPLVIAAGDDDAMAASRPVILGSYAESTAIDDERASSAVGEPVGTDQPESDFILDLPEVKPAAVDAVANEAEPQTEPSLVAPAEPASVNPPVAPVESAGPVGGDEPRTASELTCDDCVYVATCPNKDQRDPASCGSFQWK